jgi:hypothetical protein
MKKFIALATAVAMALISVAAQATTILNQGLRADTSGWFDVVQIRGNYGAVTLGPTGTISLSSDNGSSYDFGNSGNTAWDLGQGFDFDVAPAGTNGPQHRGFLIHSALTSTGLVIGSVVDLNRHDSDNPYPPPIGSNHYGWFTLVEVPPGLAIDKTKNNIVPGSLLLLGSGMVGLALYRRRRAGSEG